MARIGRRGACRSANAGDGRPGRCDPGAARPEPSAAPQGDEPAAAMPLGAGAILARRAAGLSIGAALHDARSRSALPPLAGAACLADDAAGGGAPPAQPKKVNAIPQMGGARLRSCGNNDIAAREYHHETQTADVAYRAACADSARCGQQEGCFHRSGRAASLSATGGLQQLRRPHEGGERPRRWFPVLRVKAFVR